MGPTVAPRCLISRRTCRHTSRASIPTATEISPSPEPTGDLGRPRPTPTVLLRGGVFFAWDVLLRVGRRGRAGQTVRAEAVHGVVVAPTDTSQRSPVTDGPTTGSSPLRRRAITRRGTCLGVRVVETAILVRQRRSTRAPPRSPASSGAFISGEVPNANTPHTLSRAAAVLIAPRRADHRERFEAERVRPDGRLSLSVALVLRMASTGEQRHLSAEVIEPGLEPLLHSGTP